jgi:hypothetical protein
MGRVVQQITTTDLQKLRVTHWVAMARKVSSSLDTQCQLLQLQLQQLD